MANTAVIFKSKYGATKKYAIHISKALEADMYDSAKMKNFDFEKYDTIIFGGGLYAGKVNGIKFLSSNNEKLSGKTVVIFTTGIGDPSIAKNAQEISKHLDKALPKETMNKAHLYSFRGELDYDKLSFLHKTMMSMLKKMIQKKSEANITDDDKSILENYGKAVDYTDLSTASPLIEFVKGL